MNYFEAFNFTASCLGIASSRFEAEKIKEQILHDNIYWEKVVKVSSNHLVMPALAFIFNDKGIDRLLPESLDQYLQHILQLNTQRNERILKQAREVNLLLSKEGIYPIFLKGVACIADGIYPKTGCRMIGDMDILVSDNVFLKAVEVLKQAGYSSNTPFFNEDILRIKHYPRLVNEKKLAAVEVHRLPVDMKYSNHFNYSIVQASARSATLFSELLVLNDYHKVIHLFIHSQLANKEHIMGTISLRYSFELLLLLHRSPKAATKMIPKYKRKFDAFVALSKELFTGVNQENGCIKSGYQNRFFLFHKYKKCAKIYWISLYLGSRVLNYFRLGVLVFYDKGIRKSIGYRLTNKNWYRQHLNSYILALKKR